MTINSGVFSVRRMKVLGPTDTAIPLSSEVHEPVGPDLLGAEIITKTQFTGFDVHGSPIGADTQLVFCSELKTPIAIFNAFACPICRGYFSTFYMAQEIVPDPLSAAVKPSMRQGICKRCYDKGKPKRVIAAILNIAAGILHFVFAPFLASSSETPPGGDGTPRKPGPSAAGGAAVAVFFAVGLLAAAPSQTAGISVHAGVPDSVSKGGHMSDSQPALGKREVVALIDEALLYGVDDLKLGSAGTRCIRNLETGLETGQVSEYDFLSLQNLVVRAKRFILPMPWRPAFRKNPPAEIITPGDIQPMTLLDGTPVGLSFLEMAEAIRSTGRPGSGKTTGAGTVLDPCISAGKSVFFIDSKGTQGNWLCRKHPGRVLKMRIGQPNRPWFNLWQWPAAIRDYVLQITSRHDSKIVLDAAIEQSRKQNALSGACEITHAQLMRNIVQGTTPVGFPFIPRDFFRSMYSIFYDIECSPLRPQIACQRGYSLREMLSKGLSLVADTSAIAGSLHEEVFVCSLLAALRQEIKADPVLCTKYGTIAVFFIDECTFLAAASRVPTGLPPLVHLATLVRSSSISLFCIYHSVAIVHPVLNAAGIWMVTQISDGDDLFKAKKMFSLTDQQGKALTSLPKGIAVMRMGNRYTEPFLVRYPAAPDPSAMTDAEADANNAVILANLSPIIPENYRKIPVPIVPPPATVPATPPPASGPAPTVAAVVVSPAPTVAVTNDYMAILRDIAVNPFLNVSARAGQLKLPSGNALTFKALKAALDDLNSQGFVGEVSVHLAPHAGSPSLMHCLTAEGHAAIGSLHKPPRGGYEHDLGQRLIKHILAERSIPATIEMVLPGTTKMVDVGVICPVTRLAVAIELAISTAASTFESDQAERDLSAGWARVLVVTLNKYDLASAVKAFARRSLDPDSRVHVCLISALKAMSSLPEIYDSSEFVVKVNRKNTRTKSS